MIEISEKQFSLIARDNLVPAYLTIGGIQQEYRVTQIDSSFSGYGGRKFIAELEKVPVSESVEVATKVETKQDKYIIKHIDLKVGDYLLREDFSKLQWSFLQENWKPNVAWYDTRESGMVSKGCIVFSKYPCCTTCIGSSGGEMSVGRRITPDMLLWTPVYKPENIVVTCKCNTLTTSKAPTQPKKDEPELKYIELWMADTSKDMMGVMSGYLTHGKYYDVLSTYSSTFGGLVFKVVTDAGHIAPYGYKWFKPVRLYDEDQSELICRDIEFVEGDYIDKNKWTPEQLIHLSKFYKFYRLATACKKDLPVLVWDIDGEWLSGRAFECTGKEYTYDDIFYSEE